MTKKLGVSIPTYKRPELLKKSVESVINSAKNREIPIYICDDSCDETNKDTIIYLQSKYGHIKYIKNETNLGIDRNICKCVDVADTEYVWLLGEDDLLVENAIDRILNVLETKDYGFIYSEYAYVSNDFKYILKKRMHTIKDDIVLNSEDFIKEYLWSIGFIGGCVINKNLWANIEKDKYYDTYFAHVGTISESLKNQNVYMTTETLVYNRAEDTSTFTWSQDAFKVFYGWEDMLNMLRSIYNDEIVDSSLNSSKILFNHKSNTWLASKRADNLYNYTVYKEYIKEGMVPFLIAILPVSLFKLLKFIRKRIPQLIFRQRIE